jgi:hypothetical protein
VEGLGASSCARSPASSWEGSPGSSSWASGSLGATSSTAGLSSAGEAAVSLRSTMMGAPSFTLRSEAGTPQRSPSPHTSLMLLPPDHPADMDLLVVITHS